jgi:hypothetical protein
MIDHEAVIKQQMLDQTIIEEMEFGTEYGVLEELDPALNPDIIAKYREERYDYGEERIEIGRGQKSFRATKLG